MRQGKRFYQKAGSGGRRIRRTISAPSVFMGVLTEAVPKQQVGVSPVSGVIRRLSVSVEGLSENQTFELSVYAEGNGALMTVSKEKQVFAQEIPVVAGDLISINAVIPTGVSLAYGGVLVMARSELAEFEKENDNVEV